jgi:hypothetical protein
MIDLQVILIFGINTGDLKIRPASLDPDPLF